MLFDFVYKTWTELKVSDSEGLLFLALGLRVEGSHSYTYTQQKPRGTKALSCQNQTHIARNPLTTWAWETLNTQPQSLNL